MQLLGATIYGNPHIISELSRLRWSQRWKGWPRSWDLGGQIINSGVGGSHTWSDGWRRSCGPSYRGWQFPWLNGYRGRCSQPFSYGSGCDRCGTDLWFSCERWLLLWPVGTSRSPTWILRRIWSVWLLPSCTQSCGWHGYAGWCCSSRISCNHHDWEFHGP